MTSPYKPWIETPLKESTPLSRAAGCRILLKLETLQPSGSFKSRGISNYILARLYDDSQTTSSPISETLPFLHFYSSSGGNAGLACAHAASSLGYPCTVVVPHSTSALMIAHIKAAGAHTLIQHGASWKEADAYLRETVLAADPGGVYVPPFDHVDIWEGHATMMQEIKKQMDGKKPAAVVCSVGGGGLLCGVVRGLEEAGWGRVEVVAVETEGAESLAKSLEKGEVVTLEGITSRATSLGAVRVCDGAWEVARRGNVRSVVLSDAEAAMGCWRLADDERVLVEMSCGVSVALCYDGRLEKALGRKLGREDTVVVVLCGGSNVTLDMLVKWREEFGWVEKGMPKREDVPSEQTAPSGYVARGGESPQPTKQ